MGPTWHGAAVISQSGYGRHLPRLVGSPQKQLLAAAIFRRHRPRRQPVAYSSCIGALDLITQWRNGNQSNSPYTQPGLAGLSRRHPARLEYVSSGPFVRRIKGTTLCGVNCASAGVRGEQSTAPLAMLLRELQSGKGRWRQR